MAISLNPIRGSPRVTALISQGFVVQDEAMPGLKLGLPDRAMGMRPAAVA